MAERWSNPSGGLGFDRFKVWPAGSDPYNHTELVANWDEADAIIGIPSSGNWPPTTGVDGGIYKEVRLLQLERMPIGSVVAFFKPTDGYALPDGWAVCDGSSVSDHDFTGIANPVTLPDLRNRFILGADTEKLLGASAATVDGGSIDSASGAPGPQATGGSNEHTLVKAEMPSHNHGGGRHTHWFGKASKFLPSNGGGTFNAAVEAAAVGTDVIDGSAPNPNPVVTTYPSTAVILIDGADQPHENRPNWIGLIYLCKVKWTDSI